MRDFDSQHLPTTRQPEDGALHLSINTELHVRAHVRVSARPRRRAAVCLLSSPVVLPPCRCSALLLARPLSLSLSSFLAFVPRLFLLLTRLFHIPLILLPADASALHPRPSIPANGCSIPGNSGRRTQRKGSQLRSDLSTLRIDLKEGRTRDSRETRRRLTVARISFR